MNKITKCLLLLMICSHSIAFAWWDKGHMIVAKIAEEQLDENVKIQVEQLIDVIGESCPDSATFVEAACWLDDVCDRGMSMGWAWHSSARPYDPQGILSYEEHKEKLAALNGNDGVAVIVKCIETLSNKTAGEWEKAFMLRVLLHVVGDIHCPMHCITRYTEEFPDGDHIGTRFKLSGLAELDKKNVHSLWDSIVLLDTSRDFRPLDIEALRTVEDLSDMITELHPEQSMPERKNLCVEDWAQESYDAGIEAYNGIEPHAEPSREYLERSQAVACKRLALAGYRLADILNACFSE